MMSSWRRMRVIIWVTTDLDLSSIVRHRKYNTIMIPSEKITGHWYWLLRYNLSNCLPDEEHCIKNITFVHRKTNRPSLNYCCCYMIMFSLICIWINDWVNNNREAGDLRRYRAHYDVSVMKRTLVFSALLSFCTLTADNVCLLKADLSGISYIFFWITIFT